MRDENNWRNKPLYALRSMAQTRTAGKALRSLFAWVAVLAGADGDTIADADEGAAQAVDTDNDGTPDFEDPDSDGDGIPDYREAGDSDAASKPLDSDLDGTPDFRDTDSDNNGRRDDLDGLDDLDGDSVANFQDIDDDGDQINDIDEIGPNPLQPVDTDNDGMPDCRDTDSDNDTIVDFTETNQDFDQDGAGNFIDLDSDADCISDVIEAAGSTPPPNTDGDHHYDFIDRDSDNDGVADPAEDTNCNGAVDAGETSVKDDDNDNDGVSDLIEVAAGTEADHAQQTLERFRFLRAINLNQVGGLLLGYALFSAQPR